MKNWFGQTPDFDMDNDSLPYGRRTFAETRSSLVYGDFELAETVIKDEKPVSTPSVDTIHKKGVSELVYYISEGLLEGVLNGDPLLPGIKCHSGGGGGHKDATKKWLKEHNVEAVLYDDVVVDDPVYEGQKEKKDKTGAYTQRGGPIPEGKYKVYPNPGPKHGASLGPVRAMLELEALTDPQPNDTRLLRGGFYIHGRGVLGSDGCIVVLDRAELAKVVSGLAKSKTRSLTVKARKWAQSGGPAIPA